MLYDSSYLTMVLFLNSLILVLMLRMVLLIMRNHCHIPKNSYAVMIASYAPPHLGMMLSLQPLT